MATIATRVFGDGTSTLMTLYSEEFVRTLGFQNGWQKIRLSMLLGIQTAGNFTMTANNGFGICTGNAIIANTLGLRSGSTTNWIGSHSCLASVYGSMPFTYSAGPPAYTSSTSMYDSTKRGAAFPSANGNGTAVFWAVAGSGNRSFWIVDITKIGLASATVTMFTPTSAAQAQTNYNMTDLLWASEQMRASSPVIMKGVSINNHPVSGGLAADESFGVWDTLSILWQNPATPLEVYGIVVSGIYGTGS